MKRHIVTAVSAIVFLCACIGIYICIASEEHISGVGTKKEYAGASADETAVFGIQEESAGADDEITEGNTEKAVEENFTEPFTQEATQDYLKVKGIYVTGPIAGSGRMEELISLVDGTELNAMVIDVKNDEGNITWKMDSASVNEMGNGIAYISDINALMATLKEHGIYTIARIVCFKDPVFAQNHSGCALKKPDGTSIVDGYGLAWVNPYSEEVWEYLVEIAGAAADAGFDEIQFDYVRFPIGSDAEAADYGVDTGVYTKEQAISGFLSYACEKLHEKNITVAADVFGTVIGSETDIVRVGQDYGKLGEILDVLSPMVYPSHYGNGVFGLDVPDAHPYDTVYNALLLSQVVLEQNGEKNRARVRPWLQAFTASWIEGHISYGSTQINEQIQAVYDAGYDEWIFWNASNRYDFTFAIPHFSANP